MVYYWPGYTTVTCTATGLHSGYTGVEAVRELPVGLRRAKEAGPGGAGLRFRIKV